MAPNLTAMPGADRNDESGRYQPTYPLERFVDAIDAEGGMAGTQDVTDRVGCSYELAYKRLNQLEDEGRVTSRKIGNARLWQLVDEPDDGDDDHESAGDESAPDRREIDPAPEPDRSPAPEPDHDERPDVETVVDDVAAGWDDDHRLEDRKAAAVAVLTHAIETGDPVGKGDAVEQFYDEYPVDGQNAETWWRQNVRPVLQAVGDYSRGHHGYRVDPDRLAEVADSR